MQQKKQNKHSRHRHRILVASSTMSIRQPSSLVCLALFKFLAARLVLPTAMLAGAQPCPSHQTEALISITSDDFPAEISWKIADSLSGSVVCSRDFAKRGMSSRQTKVDSCCLDNRYGKKTPAVKEDGSGDGSVDDRQLQPAGREYTFSITDSYGDGMCCSHGRGRFAVSIGGKIVVDGRSNEAAAFGLSASSKFIVVGSTPSPTPTPAPWWTPYPTSTPTTTTDTMEPTDEVTMYPTVSFEYYMHDCPPTSVMGSKGFSSEFNGCIMPTGCRFLATPYWDNGSFREEACWYCCSSEVDTCGICSGCECGYSPSATPAPTPWMEEENSTKDPSRLKAIFGVLIFIAMLIVGCIFVCMVSFCCNRKDRNSDGSQNDGGSGTVAGRTTVAGSLVSSATILPSITQVPPIPVASAVSISCSEDDRDIAMTPVAKVVSMDYVDNAVPRPSAPPPPSAPTADEAIGRAAGESLAACLSEAGSFGRTEAIAEWMRDNSSLASSFSPDDMALALLAVSFSLDQPLAAREIAAGVAEAGGSITCDHVVKALAVCDKSARLEVARGMATFVSDLANEETILSLFESSYEREQVDRAMNR